MSVSQFLIFSGNCSRISENSVLGCHSQFYTFVRGKNADNLGTCTLVARTIYYFYPLIYRKNFRHFE